jgi:iron transport multicopper oxidase
MGLIGVYAVASYGMKTDSKKKRTAEREPLLASGEAGAESEPTGRSVNGENVVRR